ncbi:MAG: rhomboid family intramembrane serine protease [Chloroflexi bacterium]|nr:rhomboid family intramembrane serine protease [Anaerolineaceae bacterium]NMB91095.1 rhomboid family intramembrane serine protease [Chloroflexota bacterium]
MLPIKDTIRSQTFPLVNWLLIAANVLAFFYEQSLPSRALEQFFLHFALVPGLINPLHPATLLPFFTHMFLHGSWLHIISNVWVLFIFGDNVEDRMGSGRFLLFYLLGGLFAGLIQFAISPGSMVPVLGASGAIAAVMGAYFFYYPRAKVLTLIPVFILPWFVEIPSIVFLGFWFVSQIFSGFSSLVASAGMDVGGVAWFAHIGGFLFGLLMARPFCHRVCQPGWHPDEYYPW